MKYIDRLKYKFSYIKTIMEQVCFYDKTASGDTVKTRATHFTGRGVQNIYRSTSLHFGRTALRGSLNIIIIHIRAPKAGTHLKL